MSGATHVLSLSQFIGQLGKLPDDLEAAIVRGLRSAALRGVSICVEQINSPNPANGAPPPVDEGTLMRSVKYAPRARGGAIEIDAPHAAFMEVGTRPHRPPLQPLVDWAKRKFQVDDVEATRIARAVAAKIEKFGLAPRAFMERTVEVLEREKIALQEIERELNRLP